jgi:hypothetical protein
MLTLLRLLVGVLTICNPIIICVIIAHLLPVSVDPLSTPREVPEQTKIGNRGRHLNSDHK